MNPGGGKGKKKGGMNKLPVGWEQKPSSIVKDRENKGPCLEKRGGPGKKRKEKKCSGE